MCIYEYRKLTTRPNAVASIKDVPKSVTFATTLESGSMEANKALGLFKSLWITGGTIE